MTGDGRKSRMDVNDFMILNRRLDNIKDGYEVLRSREDELKEIRLLS